MGQGREREAKKRARRTEEKIPSQRTKKRRRRPKRKMPDRNVDSRPEEVEGGRSGKEEKPGKARETESERETESKRAREREDTKETSLVLAFNCPSDRESTPQRPLPQTP